jgi:hypothetical protein
MRDASGMTAAERYRTGSILYGDQLMTDEDVRAALSAEGVILTDWREIMQRFEGRPSLSE